MNMQKNLQNDPKSIMYHEVKRGSVLAQVKRLNNRDDCFFDGKYTLISPRPYGPTCSDFIRLCNYSSRVSDNVFSPYKVEQVLTYEKAETRASDKIALQANELNAHDVKLVDFSLKGRGQVEMDYLVDEELAPFHLMLPFLYLPHVQFCVDVRIGKKMIQKLAIVFARDGAIIYELSRNVKQFTPTPWEA